MTETGQNKFGKVWTSLDRFEQVYFPRSYGSYFNSVFVVYPVFVI